METTTTSTTEDVPDAAIMDPESEEFQKLLDPDRDDLETDDSAKATKAESEGGSSSATEDDAGEKEPVVLAADSKTEIPYSVLQAERERAAEQTRRANELETQLRELQARVDSGGNVSESEASDVDTKLAELSEYAAKLKDEFPALSYVAETLGSVVKAVGAQMAGVNKLATDHEAALKRAEEDQRAVMRKEVEETVGKNDVLRGWRDGDPEAWSRAKAFDNTLMADPLWGKKPMAERFAKVVELVRGVYPDAKVPAKTETKEELERKAKAVLEHVKESGPGSLSDMRGGRSPDAHIDVDKLDVIQLESMMEKMTNEQLDAFLAKNA